MKKLLTLLLGLALLCLSPAAKAQVVPDTAPWCPPGATWVYSNGGAGIDEQFVYHYERDTLLQGLFVKVISVKLVMHSTGTPFHPARFLSKTFLKNEYAFERNDSIFKFNPETNLFDFVYSFNPSLGDKIYHTFDSASVSYCNFTNFSDSVAVDSFSHWTFNNRLYQMYRTTQSKMNEGLIIKNIGPISGWNNLFESSVGIDSCPNGFPFGRFLYCFGDYVRGISFDTVTPNRYYCDSLVHLILKAPYEKGLALTPKVFPNPTNGVLHISSANQLPIAALHIYDMQGRLVYTTQPQQSQTSLQIAHLPNGLYLVRLTDNQNTHSFTKFIKTN